MSEFLTPQEFKHELKTNPLFVITLIFENQPDYVIEKMNEKGIFPASYEDALLTLKSLLEQGKGELLHGILSQVQLNFEEINEMYHAPLTEALKGM